MDERHAEPGGPRPDMAADLIRLAAELATSRARLAHLVRSSPAVIYSLTADPPHRLTHVSENVAGGYGYTASQLLQVSGLTEAISVDESAEAALAVR